jgi:hypothetical protein
MAGIGINHRDHPVGGDLAGDPEAAIGVLLQILARHRRHQAGSLGHRRG